MLINLFERLPLDGWSLNGLELVMVLGLELLYSFGDVLERALGLGRSTFAFVRGLLIVCLVVLFVRLTTSGQLLLRSMLRLARSNLSIGHCLVLKLYRGLLDVIDQI